MNNATLTRKRNKTVKKKNQDRVPPKDKELKQYHDPKECLSAFSVLRKAFGKG